MTKIKYLVTGIDNTVLGNLVGLLISGELESGNDLVCCPGDPKAYKVGENGQIIAIPFDNLLSTLVFKERARLRSIQIESSSEKIIREVVEIEKSKSGSKNGNGN